ncbi:VirB3 family type IV secretion system protein [Muricoccus vinaceus]|uniref:VirB3 family type IV secretion system protein n=1 Tax=Muricoccus vinaceus TaxID=424704 RepID=A0ABV6IZS2_9PROT
MAARTINQALVRPERVAGCEKMPLGVVVTSGILFGMVGWWFWSIPAAVMAALCFGVGLPTVRRMGKADPQLTRVYLANLGFRTSYSARTPAHLVEPEAGQRGSAAGWIGTAAIILLAAGWLFGSVMIFGLGVLTLIGIPLARKAARPT